MRVPHIIRANKSGAAPAAWVVLHTQAFPQQLSDRRSQHVFAGAAGVYWRPARVSKPEVEEWVEFVDPDAMVDWLVSKLGNKERLALVLHNAGYHLLVSDLHGGLAARGFEITRHVLEDQRFVQRWRRRSASGKSFDASLLILDIRNWYPVGLRDLAGWCAPDMLTELVLAEGGEGSFDPPQIACVIVLAALRRWLQFRVEHDLGYFAHTIAAQAFNAYRHRYMHVPIYVHCHNDVIRVERNAYYGGRVEAFFLGDAPANTYYQLDFNSLYPSIMRQFAFPTRQVFHWYDSNPTRLAQAMRTYFVLAAVTLVTDEPCFPKRITDELVYPVGRYDTTLATPELFLALEMNAIARVHEVVGYEHANLFADYVDAFWTLRLQAQREGDLYTARLCKMLLNTLFGKFGQRLWQVSNIALAVDRPDEMWTELDLEDGHWKEYRSVAGRLDVGERNLPAHDTLIAIPAHVTSHARVLLWQLILRAGFRHVYYCDTDSVIVDQAGYDALGAPTRTDALGGLRLADVGTQLRIFGRKWYTLDHHIVHSGVRNTAREVAPNTYSQSEYRSLEWSLQNNYPHAAIVDEVEIHGPGGKTGSISGIGGWTSPRVFG